MKVVIRFSGHPLERPVSGCGILRAWTSFCRSFEVDLCIRHHVWFKQEEPSQRSRIRGACVLDTCDFVGWPVLEIPLVTYHDDVHFGCRCAFESLCEFTGLRTERCCGTRNVSSGSLHVRVEERERGRASVRNWF